VSEPGREALLEHVGFLRNLARGLVACEADADDVVQETLLTAIRKPPAPGNLRGWLSRVARNVALMRHRGRTRAARRELLAARGDAPPSPVEIAARLELERKVVDAVAALEEPYRSTLILHFYDGLAPAEIARHLGLPAATVRVRLNRALAKMRARLEDKSEDRRALMLGLLLLAERPRRLPLWAGAAALLVAVGGVAYVVADEPRAPRAAPVVIATEPEPPSPVPPPLLTGRVIDSYGRPRAGFTVALCEAPPRGRFNESVPQPVAQTVTDADGFYALALPKGRWLVRAGEEEATVEGPVALNFRVAGEPARGRITEGGLPVAGAIVTSRVGRAVTDRDGGFALDPPLAVKVPGPATRLFGSPPYEIVRGGIFPLNVPATLHGQGAIGTAGGEFPFDEATAIVAVPGFAPRKLRVRRGDTVALKAGRRIEGVVRCEGAPVADAEVTWLGGFDSVMEVARTGADGRFVLENVPPEAVALTATHREFLPRAFDYASFILGGPGGTMDPEIEMTRAVERRGRVVGPEGVRVTARPKGLPWTPEVRRALERAGLDWTAVTGEDGAFVLRQLPSGVPIVIVAEHPTAGAAEEIDATELRLRPWPVTDGEVVDEHGTPVGGASIRGARVRGWSEPDGRFRLFGPVEGEMVVSHPEFTSVIVRNVSRIVLPRGEAIRGIVDAPGALVLAGPRSTHADSKGAFELRGLMRGDYRVFFHAAGKVARAVDAAAPGPPLDVALERAGHLAGRVTARGAPVANARVYAIADDWAFEQATTDADGRFVLERVPERAPFALRIAAGTEARIEGVTSGTREFELP
jgi:RNA polymerase sigma-70 factor (ECF subfamily)